MRNATALCGYLLGARGLSRAIDGATSQPDLARQAGNGDDAAAASVGHLRRQRADQEVRRLGIGGKQPVQGRPIEVRSRRGVPAERASRVNPVHQAPTAKQPAREVLTNLVSMGY
jgi:hypothetical protein